MKVSIVIPNWNGEEKLKKNLPDVLLVRGVDEVIVVDDGSTDKSVDVVKNNFPKIKLIEKKVNSGFSATVNQGVKESSGDLVFVLNTDAKPEVDLIKYVLPHFENPEVFSVSCNVGGSWSWANFKKGYFWHYVSNKPLTESHQTLWSSGGSGIFRKSVWEKLDGFDTLYSPFYEEDMDLGYRATKMGYINIIEPKAKVEHYKQKGVIEENFSKSKIAKVAQRNQLIFIWKCITDSNLIYSHVFWLFVKLITHPKYIAIFLSALIKLPQILKKRQSLSKKNKLTDSQIINLYTK